MPDGTSTTLPCPTCGPETTLVAVDRSGVLVDACPRCRGIWLDRGELDKLIELEAQSSDGFIEEIQGGSRRDDDEDGYDDGHGSGGHGSKQKRRRGSFLGEMFDFG